MQDQTPGGIISPQSQENAAPEPPVLAPSPPPQTPLPTPQAADPQAQQVPPAVADSSLEPQAPFIADFESTDSNGQSRLTQQSVAWTASEYIAHKKTVGWFVALGAAATLLTIVVFFLTDRDIVSSLAVLIISILFGVIAGRQPREQSYLLDDQGIHIGLKTYSFDTVKSFSIIEERPFSSISFMPMKRFMPMISVYYDPADEEKIVAFLTDRLPIEYRKRDVIDRFMKKIKF